MTHTTTTKALRRSLPTRSALLAPLAAVAALAALAAGAAPAGAAAGPDRRTAPDTWLYLTVTHGDVLPPGLATVRPGHSVPRDTRGALLLCDPPQGHGQAAEACAQLTAADGAIRSTPPRDTLCPMVFAPVTAEARGLWQGRPVEYRESFANACELAARTGAVFALDT
ncbi:SSI family serine proteinase inhibitor [Streptomyces sp. NPDC001595]|uniref:SSI family serine proteinase inhibitor n=1 Tax=Streptomyces sp. NPDC001532 TaxID=3154520 RepID=UPI00332BAF1C